MCVRVGLLVCIIGCMSVVVWVSTCVHGCITFCLYCVHMYVHVLYHIRCVVCADVCMGCNARVYHPLHVLVMCMHYCVRGINTVDV